MKHLNEFMSVIAVGAAALSFYVLATINTAQADHNGNEKAHPTILAAVAAVDTKVELVALKVELSQNANEEDHERIEKQMEQMTSLLISINAKL